jgi:RNA polymerase sigma-70 factor (ECF subfamily)
MEREAPVATSRAAVERLWVEEGERLSRAVLAFTHDRGVMEDAVSEAFAQCIRRGDDIRDPRAWVWRAAFNIAAGELKERGRWKSLPAIDPSYEMSLEPPERLLAALATLTPMQRATVVLTYYADYSGPQVAAILGTTHATVRVHLSRGRRHLRRLLGEEEVTDA